MHTSQTVCVQNWTKKAKKLRFVGDVINSTGYSLLDEATLKVVVRRDVVFNEVDFGELHKMYKRSQIWWR